MRSSKGNDAEPSSSSTRPPNTSGRENTKFSGSLASSTPQSNTTASTRTSRNEKRHLARQSKQQSRERQQTSRQRRRQQELDEYLSGDEYDSSASTSLDTDRVPGSYAVNGPSRSSNRRRPQPTNHDEESTSALPVALPAELVPEDRSNSNPGAITTLVLATAAPDKQEDGDGETKQMLQNQKRMLWIGLILISVLALAIALGFGIAFGPNREVATVAGGGETVLAPPTPAPVVTTSAPSKSPETTNNGPPTISDTASPAPGPSTSMQNPTAGPTAPPTMPKGTCSCWYYIHDIFITALEDQALLPGDRISYWDSVYRGLTSFYDPNALRRRRRLPEEILPNTDGIVIATSVVLESQRQFGGGFARLSGLSMAFQLEFCANPPPLNATTSYLMDYHDAFLDWVNVEANSDVLVGRLQEEVGITSAIGTSLASRVDLQCD
jgi:hypothetical protein